LKSYIPDLDFNAMKIILIDNSVDTTGASKSLFNTIREICVVGAIEFVYIHPKGSKRTAVVRKAGFKSYELPFVEIKKSVIQLLSYFPFLLLNAYRVSQIAEKENADLIHVNDLYNMTAVVSKLFRKTKVVTHIRRMPESFPLPFYKAWSYINVWFADRIIAVSNANKNALPANSKTVVIYNPLPDSEKHELYRARPRLKKKAKILYLANYNRGKGHQYAIEIVAKAIHNFPDWSLTLNIYGGDFGLEKNCAYKRELKQMAIDKGIEAHVQFHDKVNDVEKIMKEHDIILNLSDSESFSRLTLESLFYGIPIIATDVGGTREMLIDKEGGLLVPPKDTRKMYEALATMMLDDKIRCSFSLYSYTFVRDNFSMKKTSEKIKDLYDACVGNHRRLPFREQ
jgi:L-malate glycosyltransferase